MKKPLKVLTRMRLSCCWENNLDEKELSDVVDYINELKQKCKKQKEVIDRVRNNLEKDISMIKTITMCKEEIITRLEITDKILNEVSDE